MNNQTSAFTLIELSIVLVILGLLVGGILAGRELIRAAELRSIPTQFQQFMTAHHAFREKYFAVAGDMVNATRFWGAASAVNATACADALEAGVTGTQTCNGLGDGFVQNGGKPNAEIVLYWQHLSNAGLIEGRYTGFSHVNPGSCCFRNTDNSARGRLGKSIWIPLSNAAATVISPFNYSFGAQQAPLGGMPAGSGVDNILTPVEIQGIDIKMDDGKPNLGNVRAFYTGANLCSTAHPTISTGEYILTESSIACYARFFIGR